MQLHLSSFNCQMQQAQIEVVLPRTTSTEFTSSCSTSPCPSVFQHVKTSAMQQHFPSFNCQMLQAQLAENTLERTASADSLARTTSTVSTSSSSTAPGQGTRKCPLCFQHVKASAMQLHFASFNCQMLQAQLAEDAPARTASTASSPVTLPTRSSASPEPECDDDVIVRASSCSGQNLLRFIPGSFRRSQSSPTSCSTNHLSRPPLQTNSSAFEKNLQN